MPFTGIQEIIWCLVSNTPPPKPSRRGRPSKKPKEEIEDISTRNLQRINFKRYDQIMKIIMGDNYEGDLGRSVKGCTRSDLMELCNLVNNGRNSKDKKYTVHTAAKVIASRKYPPAEEKDNSRKKKSALETKRDARKTKKSTPQAGKFSQQHASCIEALVKWHKKYGICYSRMDDPTRNEEIAAEDASKRAIFEVMTREGWPGL